MFDNNYFNVTIDGKQVKLCLWESKYKFILPTTGEVVPVKVLHHLKMSIRSDVL